MFFHANMLLIVYSYTGVMTCSLFTLKKVPLESADALFPHANIFLIHATIILHYRKVLLPPCEHIPLILANTFLIHHVCYLQHTPLKSKGMLNISLICHVPGMP